MSEVWLLLRVRQSIHKSDPRVSVHVCQRPCLAVEAELFRDSLCTLWILSMFPWDRTCVHVLLFSPVSEFWAQSEVVSEEVLLWWDGPLQPEEGVVLHAGLPQVFTGPIVHHVETQQRFPGLSLFTGRRKQLVGHWITLSFSMWGDSRWPVFRRFLNSAVMH